MPPLGMGTGDTTTREPMLVTRVGGLLCALPIGHVVETMRPLPIEPLAAIGPELAFVSGVAVVRGAPIPVVDAARLLDQPAGAQNRFVIVRTSSPGGDARVALWVDTVLDVRAFERAAIAELPPLLHGANRDIVSAIGTVDRALLVVLDAGRVVPEAWQAIRRSDG